MVAEIDLTVRTIWSMETRISAIVLPRLLSGCMNALIAQTVSNIPLRVALSQLGDFCRAGHIVRRLVGLRDAVCSLGRSYARRAQ